MTCEPNCECCIDQICRSISECEEDDKIVIIVIAILTLFFVILIIVTCYFSCKDQRTRRRRNLTVQPSSTRDRPARRGNNLDSQTLTFGPNEDRGRNRSRRNGNSNSKKEKIVVKGTPEDKMPEMLRMIDRPKTLYRIGEGEKVIKISLLQSSKDRANGTLIDNEKKLKRKGKESNPRMCRILMGATSEDFKFKTSQEVITKPNMRSDFHSCSQPVAYDEGQQDISHISGISDDLLIPEKDEERTRTDKILDDDINLSFKKKSAVSVGSVKLSEEDEKEIEDEDRKSMEDKV